MALFSGLQRKTSGRLRRFTAVAAIVLCLIPNTADAYSILTHEEVVDMAWLQHMVPVLKARYPGLTDDQIREAHAYAYGGCMIQDLGYYPHGSKLFSDLTHYVRSGDFVQQLLDDSTTPDELAFALGALAHYTSDETGHPYVNEVTAQEFPKLREKYGPVVTYEEGPSHHLRTEFGFDVVGVSRGKYAQEDYRSFIGFQVAKPLLERAFAETYGIPLSSVISDEDKSIGSARWAVHTLIPKMTKVALLTYHDNIEQANPGFQRNKFLYRLNRTEYEKNWHEKYQKPGFGSHVLAVLITILPKVGPLKALKLSLPNADQQTIYIKSVNETLDRLDTRLDKILSTTTPAPIPVVAQSNGKAPDAGTAPAADTSVQKAANSAGEVQGAGAITSSAAAATSGPATIAPRAQAVAAATSVQDAPALPESAVAQPMGETPLKLTSVDLDTGKPTGPGEYGLADKTYAALLERLAAEPPTGANAAARHDVLLYFGPDQAAKNRLSSNAKQWAKVQAALTKLQAQAGDTAKASGLQ